MAQKKNTGGTQGDAEKPQAEGSARNIRRVKVCDTYVGFLGVYKAGREYILDAATAAVLECCGAARYVD